MGLTGKRRKYKCLPVGFCKVNLLEVLKRKGTLELSVLQVVKLHISCFVFLLFIYFLSDVL